MFKKFFKKISLIAFLIGFSMSLIGISNTAQAAPVSYSFTALQNLSINNPIGVSHNGERNLLAITSRGENAVKLYTINSDGSNITLKTTVSGFNQIWNTKISHSGNILFVSDYSLGVVKIYSIGSNYSLTQVGAISGLAKPEGLAVNHNNQLVVGATDYFRIYNFTESGSFSLYREISRPGVDKYGVNFSQDEETLFINDFTNNKVFLYDASQDFVFKGEAISGNKFDSILLNSTNTAAISSGHSSQGTFLYTVNNGVYSNPVKIHAAKAIATEISGDGTLLFLADYTANTVYVLKVFPSFGVNTGVETYPQEIPIDSISVSKKNETTAIIKWNTPNSSSPIVKYEIKAYYGSELVDTRVFYPENSDTEEELYQFSPFSLQDEYDNEYEFEGLNPGKDYTFTITPFNSSGSGPESEQTSNLSFGVIDDNGEVNISIESSISLTLDDTDDSVLIEGIPGSENVTDTDNQMTYSVKSNNLEGYNVTIQADQEKLLPSDKNSNSDSIPVALLMIEQPDTDTNGTSAGIQTLSHTENKLLYSQNERSIEEGDSFTSLFSLTEVPFVNADDYSGTVTYTATVN